MYRVLCLALSASHVAAFLAPALGARRLAPRAAATVVDAAAEQKASFTRELWGLESLPGIAAGAEDEDVLVTIYEIGGPVTQVLSATCSKKLPMIPHVGVRLHGREYFYSDHIESRATKVMQEMLADKPQVTLNLGKPTVSEAELEAYINGDDLQSAWQPESYDVFDRNCNHFAYDMAKVVTEGGIDEKLARPVLDVTEKMLSELPEWRRAMGAHFMTQITRLVISAWGNATKKKKESVAAELGVDKGQ